MFEDETEYENSTSTNSAYEAEPARGHLHDAGSLPLVFYEPPSPRRYDQQTTTSRLHPTSGHRRRSGSVPCRRPRNHPPSSRQVRAGQSSDHVTTASLLQLPAITVPQIVVDDDDSQQPAADHDEQSPSKDVDVTPTAFRPRCQTVSLDPTDHSLSLVLPSRTLSLSTSLSTSRTLYTGDWIRLLLQRTDASRHADDDDAPVSRPL